MKELLEIFKNVKKGPKSSIVGTLLMIFGGYLMYVTEDSFTWTSVEVGVFILGVYLCLTSDWIFNDK